MALGMMARKKWTVRSLAIEFAAAAIRARAREGTNHQERENERVDLYRRGRTL